MSIKKTKILHMPPQCSTMLHMMGFFKDFYGFADFYLSVFNDDSVWVYVCLYVGLMVLRCSPTTRGQCWRCCASLGLGRHWLCLQASERFDPTTI